jgi:Fe-S-cluster formation regulator IscX/YfhJ
MTPEDYIKLVIGLVVAIIGYFVKDLVKQLKDLNNNVDSKTVKFHDEVSILKYKVTALEQAHDTKFDNLEKIIDLKFTQQNQNIEELKSAVRHAERTINMNATVFVDLLKELKKNNINL